MTGPAQCQSCGMPMADELDNFGTQADGGRSPEYCLLCFQGGRFTDPGLTMEGMIRRAVESMISDMEIPEAAAAAMARAVIPQLRRWQAR